GVGARRRQGGGHRHPAALCAQARSPRAARRARARQPPRRPALRRAGGKGAMIPRALVVILRLHLGVILLLTDAGKLTRDQPFSVEMLAFLQHAMRNASAPYRAFVEHAVIPHATTFSVLVLAGELVAGLSLLFGVATRAGAAIAMLLFVNYMLAKGRMFWSP